MALLPGAPAVTVMPATVLAVTVSNLGRSAIWTWTLPKASVTVWMFFALYAPAVAAVVISNAKPVTSATEPLAPTMPKVSPIFR